MDEEPVTKWRMVLVECVIYRKNGVLTLESRTELLIMDKNYFRLFRNKMVYFVDEPFDVDCCDAVYFYSCNQKVNREDFSCREDPCAVVDLTRNLDAIYSAFSRLTNRNIRKAESEKTEVRINKDFNEFFVIYNAFMRKKGLVHRFSISPITLDFIKKYGTLFTARLNGKVVSGHLYIEDDSHFEGWLFASKRLEVGKEEAASIACANRLLHWEAMKHAKQKGIKEFNFGSIDLLPNGAAAADQKTFPRTFFKLSFGSVPRIKYCYTKYYSYLYKYAKNFL